MASVRDQDSSQEITVAAIYDNNKIGFLNLENDQYAYYNVNDAPNCGVNSRFYADRLGFYCGPRFNTLGIPKMTFFAKDSLKSVEISAGSGKLLYVGYILEYENDNFILEVWETPDTWNITDYPDFECKVYNFDNFNLGDVIL